MNKPAACDKCGNEEFEKLKSTSAPKQKVRAVVWVCTNCKCMVWGEE